MKVMMYSVAAAALLALGACDDSSTPAVTPPPTPDPTREVTSPVTQDGTTTTYRNGSNENLERLVRNTGYSLTGDTWGTHIAGAQGVLGDAIQDKTVAETELDRLSSFADLSNPADLGVATEAVTRIGDIALALGADLVADGYVTDWPLLATTDVAALTAGLQSFIDDVLEVEISNAETNLASQQQFHSNTTGSGPGSITLADGTVLRTVSNGYTQATTDGAYVSARYVAAYEEDSTGNIVRVAFVETSGADYTAPASATGTYSAVGDSFFAVRVDNTFFRNLYGDSRVNLDLARESGVVNAYASDLFGTTNQVFYDANVTFDPTTGQFSSNNGELVYDYSRWFGPSGSAGFETITASNAQLLGQLHGEYEGQFGADYSGLITVDPGDSGRLEAVGAIIGGDTGPGSNRP